MKYAEHQFQSAAHTFLMRALPDAALVWAVDHAGARTAIAGARMKSRGVIAGIPDHFVLLDGQLIMFEWKAAQGRTSAAQDEFAAKARANGALYYVCKTLIDIESILRTLGIKLRATAGGLDERLQARMTAAPKKPVSPRVKTATIARVRQLRKKVMF